MMTRTNQSKVSTGTHLFFLSLPIKTLPPPKTKQIIPNQRSQAARARGPPTSANPHARGGGRARFVVPDAYRDEAWHRRKSNCRKQKQKEKQRSKSVTDEDLDELKACIELGFGFEPPEEEKDADQRLSDTLPALGLYYAVNRSYKSSATPTSSFSPTPSECDSHSPIGSPHTIFGPGDNPQTVKARLKQWAQVVACTVRQSSS
ncbi:hypothetical protein M0R45_004471 [Rubus argutus]|uniref:Uncharacterized protein n=1 Tax=Rubus argutus TaxID=59490 RepID=A0AAW1YJW0_RUBAR